MFRRSGFRVVKVGTFGIRRGLRILGRYPQKKNWKRPYFASSKNYEIPAAITIPPEKKRPAAYYHFRRAAIEWREIPGMRSFGLNFTITLAPIA
jgi:hypothetical protein